MSNKRNPEEIDLSTTTGQPTSQPLAPPQGGAAPDAGRHTDDFSDVPAPSNDEIAISEDVINIRNGLNSVKDDLLEVYRVLAQQSKDQNDIKAAFNLMHEEQAQIRRNVDAILETITLLNAQVKSLTSHPQGKDVPKQLFYCLVSCSDV